MMGFFNFRAVIASVILCMLFVGQSQAEEEKKVLFYDNFDDNSNKWETKDADKFSIFIKEGYYNILHDRDEMCRYQPKTIKFENNVDFKIESIIKNINHDKKHSYGFFWGLKDIDNYYAYEVKENGSFGITKISNSEYHLLSKWRNIDNIKLNNGEENKFTIIKREENLIFKINDSKVAKIKFEPFFGNRFGFFVCDRQSIAIDSLKIAELSPMTPVERLDYKANEALEYSFQSARSTNNTLLLAKVGETAVRLENQMIVDQVVDILKQKGEEAEGRQKALIVSLVESIDTEKAQKATIDLIEQMDIDNLQGLNPKEKLEFAYLIYTAKGKNENVRTVLNQINKPQSLRDFEKFRYFQLLKFTEIN